MAPCFKYLYQCLLIASIFATSGLLADSQVRSVSLTAPLVYASNSLGSFQSMVATAPSTGSGEQEANPFITYIPLGSGATQEQCTSTASGTLLPEAISGGDAFVKITLKLNNDSGVNQKLFAAVKDGSNYEVFALSSTTTIASSANTVTQFDAIFSLANVCTNQSNSCTPISTATAAGSRETELFIYLFLVGSTSTQPNPGDVITITDDGLFYKVKVSDKMPSGTYSLRDLRKGDARLTAVVADGDLITQMGTILHKTMIYNISSGGGGVCPLAASGSIQLLENPVLNGDLNIKNLTNGTTYTFAVALVNKFQFTTLLSTSDTETPEGIEELLKKNGCFLLTAGFEGDHPTILFFRQFRDQILLGPSLGTHVGKALVALYYTYGPNAAMKIIGPSPEYNFLRKSIRATANFMKSFIEIFWTPKKE